MLMRALRISKNSRTGLGSTHIFQSDPKMGDELVERPQPTQKGIFANLGMFQFLSFVRRGVFYTFMISYLFDLMQTVTYTALLGTLNMVGSALGQNLLWGRIADRYRLRTKLIIAGESIAAVSYFIVFQIHRSLMNNQANFMAGLSLIVGLSILEFFWSMSDVGWAALLIETTTTSNRASIVGALNFIASLGRMIGISFAGYLYMNGEGFRQGTIFYIVIAMLIVGATLMWITSRSTSSQTKTTRDNQADTHSVKKSMIYDKRTYKWFLISLIVIVKALVLFAGLILAILTPLLYGAASSVPTMALFYGLNGASFWIIQTAGFAFAGDIIPENRRGRMFSRYNTVMALSWGPAGLLVGGPLADLQVKVFQLSPHTAYLNAFCASSIIVALGTAIFGLKVLRTKGSKQPST
jgi:MFS family permease